MLDSKRRLGYDIEPSPSIEELGVWYHPNLLKRLTQSCIEEAESTRNVPKCKWRTVQSVSDSISGILIDHIEKTRCN